MAESFTPRMRSVSIGGVVIVLTLGLAWLWWNTGRSSTPPTAPNALTDGGESPDAGEPGPRQLLPLEAAQAVLERGGFAPSEAASAARSLSGYVTGIASRDFQTLADLAQASGAEPDPFLLDFARKHLSVLPPHVGPKDRQNWGPKELVGFIFNMSPERWRSIDAGQITVDRFHGADALTRDLEFYRGSRQHRDATSSVYASPFTIPDLERRLQEGHAAGAVVTFPVTNQDGEKQLVSVLLGEYAPGKWYPIRHNAVSFAKAASR